MIYSHNYWYLIQSISLLLLMTSWSEWSSVQGNRCKVLLLQIYFLYILASRSVSESISAYIFLESFAPSCSSVSLLKDRLGPILWYYCSLLGIMVNSPGLSPSVRLLRGWDGSPFICYFTLKSSLHWSLEGSNATEISCHLRGFDKYALQSRGSPSRGSPPLQWR